MNEVKIKEFEFSKEGKAQLITQDKARNWPVVYLIHNDKKLYIGETQNVYNRFEQHLNDPKRKELKKIEIILDDEFNKSAILDIEQSLIQLFAADQKYELQNLNGGQSEKHNYYQRDKYLNKLDAIWQELTKRNMTNSSLEDIKNRDLFKYSPYNTLTQEQNEVCRLIIYDIMEKMMKGIDATSIIRGGAGTGKTIVLINMIYKLVNINNFNIDFSVEETSLSENIQMIKDLKMFVKNYQKEIKIGYVVPMTSIRKTLKMVFKGTKNGLNANMVIGPFDIFKDDYDILFVDEAHRLAQYKNIGYRGEFSKKAKSLGKLPDEITQLDMIVKRSKYRVLVYDEDQTVKGSDITIKQFETALKDSEVTSFNLITQMRCLGGLKYTAYLNNIFNCTQNEFLEIKNYDFRIYNDVNKMVEEIKKLDKRFGLCRNAAGYSWEWISKGCRSYEEAIKKGKEDIVIGSYKYVWNMTNEEFIISDNAINEIGCIHTLQGYDLNYIGLIFGREIDYNPLTNEIEIDLNYFYDKYVKQGVSVNQVKKFIINSYKVMMSRGIKGCYIYACNKNLATYLKRFIGEV